MKIFDILLDLFFPKRCPVCDDVLPMGSQYVCPECKEKIVYIREPFCMKCGKAISEGKEYCRDCIQRPHAFKQGGAVMDYGSVAGSLFRFKNKGRKEYAEFFAGEMNMARGDWLRAIGADALVPVPVHKSKLISRGYNQAEVLSRELSKLTGIPTNSTLVKRAKKTIPLKDLSLRDRLKNLKGAFIIGQNDVKLRSIVVIDDIYTTGSTMDEIAKVILSSMDCEVYFLTIAIGRGV